MAVNDDNSGGSNPIKKKLEENPILPLNLGDLDMKELHRIELAAFGYAPSDPSSQPDDGETYGCIIYCWDNNNNKCGINW